MVRVPISDCSIGSVPAHLTHYRTGELDLRRRDQLCLSVALTWASVAFAQEDHPEGLYPVPDAFQAGLQIEVRGGEGPMLLNFSENGVYETMSGALGGWTLQHGLLCLATQLGVVNCTDPPAELGPGTRWTETQSNGDVYIYLIPVLQDPDGEDGDGSG